MKANLSSRSVLAAALALAAGQPVAAQAPVMRDAATHEELSTTLRVAMNSNPLTEHKPAPGPDPSKLNVSESIVSQSDFLSFAGRATIVPKRAILHIPANMADRVKLQPGSQIQTWAEFYAMNRGWITTVEVTRIQAGGNEALAEELTERISKSSNLIVATFKSGPISVLPLKVPHPVQTPATAATGVPTPAVQKP
jgi:hypothetical protein